MRRERVAVAAVIVLALTLSSLPYIVAYLSAPPDRQFMGIVSSVPDWSQYLAWLRGFGNGVIIENVLTCEPQSPAFFNLQWLVLGRLANWLPPSFVLQAFRLLTSAFFLLLTYRVCAEYFRQRGGPPATWGAWLLINFSAGLGWFWVLEKRLEGLQDARFPSDIYIYEPVSFQSMLVFPHFLLAAALLLLTFRFAVAAIEEGRLSRAWIASLFALVLGLTHAYDLIVVYGVLGVFVLCLFRRDGLSWRPLVVLAIIGLVSAPPPAYFVYLTTTNPLWRQVLAQFGNAGVFTPNPAHLLILVGLPLLLTLATWRNVVPARWPQSWPLLVRVWAVVNLPLLYIPKDYQVHMLSGWQVPLGLLASEGVFCLIAPRLAARGFLRQGTAPARRFALSSWALVLLLFALSVPTNVYLLGWRVLEVLKFQHTHYLYRDEIAALKWLDVEAGNGEVVLGSLVLSQYVPFLTGDKVYVGHWAQTVHFEDRRAEVARFYDAATADDERKAMLARCGVKYVLHGRAEKELGRFDPSRAAYLTLAHADGETEIYRVDPAILPATSSPDTPRQAEVAPQVSPDWSPPLLLSGDYRSSWFPDIATDPSGGVHAVWNSSSHGADLVVYCRVGASGCVEKNNAGTRRGDDGIFNTRPSAAVDGTGMLHLLWRSKYAVAYERRFLPDPVDGWSPPRRLGDGVYNAIAVDPAGVLHAAWSAPQFRMGDRCPACSDIVYSRSADGGEIWSEPVNLSRTAMGSEKPNFAFGTDGSVYLAFEEGVDFYSGRGELAASMVIVSHDGGSSWQPPVSFWPEDVPQSPAIAVAGDGSVVAVWRSSTRDGFFSQVSTDRGATWPVPVRLPGLLRRFHSADELDGLDLATDAAGVVHLVAAGREGPTAKVNAVYHSAWNAGTWSEPVEIFRTLGTAEWPRIAIANGNELHAVWFEREENTVWDSEHGHYRVWYSRSRSDAPRIAPVVWPTPAMRLLRYDTASSLLQIVVALLLVAAVILWARRRGL